MLGCFGIVKYKNKLYEIKESVWNNVGYLSFAGIIMKKYALDVCTNSNVEQCIIGKFGNTITVPYKKLGHIYHTTLPFRRDKISNMSQLMVELLYEDGTLIDITQQPGIPYPYTAGHYGAINVLILNTITGKRTHYDQDIAPMYVDDIQYVDND